MFSQALHRFDLSALELAALVESAARAREPAATRTGETRATGVSISFVECNDHQARDLANQLEEYCGTSILPWRLTIDGEPPKGVIVGSRDRDAFEEPHLVVGELRVMHHKMSWDSSSDSEVSGHGNVNR